MILQSFLFKFILSTFFIPASFFSLLEPANLFENTVFEKQTLCENQCFEGVRTSKTNGTSADVVYGDFNNDGRLDIATLNGATSSISVQLNIGNGLLGEPRLIPSPGGFTLGSGDFNNDANLDLLIFGKILFGDGTGNFSAPQNSGINLQFVRFTVGDFNGDDKPDVAGQNGFQNPLVVYYGNGFGEFPTFAEISLTGVPNTFEAADFNGDGITDLSAVLANQNTVSVIFGSPSGTFQTPVNYPLGGTGSVELIAVGDITGDGKTDIFTTSSNFGGSDTFIVRLFNDGNGNFSVQPRLTEPTASLRRIALADLNLDGKTDYLAIFSSGYLIVRYGTGDGSFQPSIKFYGLLSETRLFVDDFTGDGKTDIAAASSELDSFTVLVNRGTGTPGAREFPLSGYNPNATVTADFNADGKADVVTANDSLELSLSFGNGSGDFQPPVSIPIERKPRYLFAEDVNNDGKKDLTVLVQNPADPNGFAVVFISNGNGTFQPAVQSSIVDIRLMKQAALKDVDGNGFPDLFVPRTNNPQFALYRGTAAGNFASAGLISTAGAPSGITVGDFNQDGNQDLAVLAVGTGVRLYFGNGNFSFTFVGTIPVRFANSTIYSADFNNDNISDLAVTTDFVSARGSNGFIGILLGVSGGGFDAVREYTLGRGPADMGIGDFNGDGNVDLAVTNIGYTSSIPYYDSRISILYGNGTGDFPQIKNFGTAFSPRGLAISDFNADGKPDIVTAGLFSETFTLMTNICPGSPAALPQVSGGSDVSVSEGNSGTVNVSVPITLNAASAVPVRVKYFTAPSDGFNRNTLAQLVEAEGSRDYLPARGTLIFNPGETSKNVTISVKGDTIDEYDEKFFLVLGETNNAVVSDRKTEITISDDDAAPGLAIANITSNEGNSGTTPFNFQVGLSAPSGKNVSVIYNTGGGTATPTSDYAPLQGVLNIPAGQTSASVTVNVIGDLIIEGNETFQVNLSEPVNASITTGRATATITNDDEGGVIALSNAIYTSTEGNNFIVNLVRTGGNGGGASVRFRTSSGTATPGQDYNEVSTIVTFAPNETSKAVAIPIQLDQTDEGTETVNIALDQPVNATIGTPANAVLEIQDTDQPPSISIANATVIEGNSGTQTIKFVLSVSSPSKLPITVNYATANGTATAPSDYQQVSAQKILPAGTLTATIDISVVGDVIPEADENFFVNLTGATNATIDDGQAVGVIGNDDVGVGSGTVKLISYNNTNTASANNDSLDSTLSDDGRFIAFISFASNIGTVSDVNPFSDIFVRDTETNQTKTLSVNSSGTLTGNCTSRRPRISGNGNFVAFDSCATDLISPEATVIGVYLRNLQTNETKLVSVASNGQQVNGNLLAINDDGRYVVFSSSDQNVTNIPDTQNFRDIFVRDTVLNTTTMVSVDQTNSSPGNGNSYNGDNLEYNVKITKNGRFVIFPSLATNLTSQTATATFNIFVRDLQTQTTKPVSVNSSNTQMVGAELRSVISEDGRYAYFTSLSSAVTANDQNSSFDVFRRDLENNTTSLVSVKADNSASGNGFSKYPFISSDGRYVAFESTAPDLQTTVPDTNQTQDIFLRDMVSGTTRMVSVNNSNTDGGNSFSVLRGMSSDAKTILFGSFASNIVSPTVDINTFFDYFIREPFAEKTFAVSVNQAGASVGNLPVDGGELALDGKVATFETYANNIVVPADVTQFRDVFSFEKATVANTKFDFDGDRKADVGVFRPANSTWYIRQSTAGLNSVVFGNSDDKIVPADYDNDGKSDYAVFRNGTWYILRSKLGFIGVNFGQAADIPQPADFDGDGQAELAVYRNGTWYVLNLVNNQFSAVSFGLASDKAVTADYDGDGKSDQAVFRPSDGTWYILGSTAGLTVINFGNSTDKAVPADYDGDGKTDIAVYRAGNWYILGSTEGFRSVSFGIATDLPVPADYDGDGKTDVAVFREGNWYILQSNSGFTTVAFGQPGDLPTPNVFVP
ncbi:MAG: FG-GAP-like repeat-containing protein [Pyrinomonadaceae bacterium]|nr:FG-GAP-like repeat-containing protein [Pyrinomonadaceae bacterium]